MTHNLELMNQIRENLPDVEVKSRLKMSVPEAHQQELRRFAGGYFERNGLAYPAIE